MDALARPENLSELRQFIYVLPRQILPRTERVGTDPLPLPGRGKFLDECYGQVMCSQIEPMKKFTRTLRIHRGLLLNYFNARKQFSISVIEGLNNKAKVTMRNRTAFAASGS